MTVANATFAFPVTEPIISRKMVFNQCTAHRVATDESSRSLEFLSGHDPDAGNGQSDRRASKASIGAPEMIA
ncbi:MAG: hypothetical protein ACRESZ_13380 [Methylococcales bacterium]